MTRQEAIDYLLDPIGKRDMHDEAVGMAIRSLEAWDRIIEFIEDYIEDYYDVTWDDGYDYDGGIRDACVDIIEEIKKHLKEVES